MKQVILTHKAHVEREWQVRWWRIVLLSVLGYEAVGCILGGILLIVAPDGRLLNMQVNILHGAFQDFSIPGLILFALGLLNTYAFTETLVRKPYAWTLALLALGGLITWFIVEIATVRELVWLHFMWGLPVYFGLLAAAPMLPFKDAMRRTLLYSGIASSVLYITMTAFIPLQWPGYSHSSQTISELSAYEAPTRPLWYWLGIFYNLFVIAFGWSVRKSAAGNRPLSIVGTLIMIYGIIDFAWPPMHQREILAAGGGTWSDTAHLIFAMIMVVLYLLTMIFGAVAFGRVFRFYSIITIALLLFFGILTFLSSEGISTNQPTPLAGVWERLNIGLFMLWVIVLNFLVIEKENKPQTS
jgi:hypothetical protein